MFLAPLKSQGAKTRLVPWIRECIPQDFQGTWIEPFMGTGAVAFNIRPRRAVLADINEHVIAFYQAIQDDKITGDMVYEALKEYGWHLETGAHVKGKDEDFYYMVRERFNREHDLLDFLFLNRTCFNGVMRFNRKGEFNVPYCRNPHRLSEMHVRNVARQVAEVRERMVNMTFLRQDFLQTIAMAEAGDIIYCDPPYIERNATYRQAWTEKQECALFEALLYTPARFVLSTWLRDKNRENPYMERLWGRYHVLTREHFYCVGPKPENRSNVTEVLVCNFC